MLTIRVDGSLACNHIEGENFKAAALLIEYPPPRTPNFPATAGSARMAMAALPPLRFRSTPQPQRMTAGFRSAYSSANFSSCEDVTPPTLAA